MLLTNLPSPLTSFIGREAEIANLKPLLLPESSDFRLLTLSGPGGVGKTRLALQLTRDLLGSFKDGIWLVELISLTDPSLIPHAIATTLSIKEEPAQLLTDALLKGLQPRQLLLLIDNCEHMVGEVAPLVETLLQNCPSLKILTTSRESLGINGEKTFRVPPLSLPPASAGVSPPTLLEYEAVNLFVNRATMANSKFIFTTQNAPAVINICQQLDGLPLALELAAARTRVLTVEQINKRLSDRFRLLTANSRTMISRQQTLQALIEWSYNLLTPPEQVLLRRLAVFSGGWNLEAAELVCTGEFEEPTGKGQIAPEEVLDLLGELVNKSLVGQLSS